MAITPACELTLDFILCGVDLLEDRDAESRGLASAVLGSCEDVTPRERNGDGLFLDRGWGLQEPKGQLVCKTACKGCRNVPKLTSKPFSKIPISSLHDE